VKVNQEAQFWKGEKWGNEQKNPKSTPWTPSPASCLEEKKRGKASSSPSISHCRYRSHLKQKKYLYVKGNILGRS
jgi:hypothetical protein